MIKPWVYMCPPHPEHSSHFLPHPITLGCPRAPALSALLHSLSVRGLSILHMVIYMFQCYSLISSHTALFHRVQKSVLYICVSFAVFAYRVVISIFLNSTYMCQYTALVFLFLTYFILYNRLIHLIRMDSNMFFFIAE